VWQGKAVKPSRLFSVEVLSHTPIYFECKESGSHTVKIEAQMKLLGDINGDGQVNIIDISIVAKYFGQNSTHSSTTSLLFFETKE
jgi:hypothetical protein